MREKINEILDKELSRRDFLKLLAGTFVMVMGVQNFISYIATKTNTRSSQPQDASQGFGSRKFGK